MYLGQLTLLIYCFQWFLGRLVRKNIYFDVRLFSPHAPPNRQSSYYCK